LPCEIDDSHSKAYISLGGYSGDDVARSLRISGRGVSDCRERGKKILDNEQKMLEYLA